MSPPLQVRQSEWQFWQPEAAVKYWLEVHWTHAPALVSWYEATQVPQAVVLAQAWQLVPQLTHVSLVWSKKVPAVEQVTKHLPEISCRVATHVRQLLMAPPLQVRHRGSQFWQPEAAVKYWLEAHWTQVPALVSW